MNVYLIYCAFFPKPISGNAFISESLFNLIRKKLKTKLIKLDFGNLIMEENLFVQKLKKSIKNLIFLFRFGKLFNIYYVKNAGYKTIYDFCFLFLAYIKGVGKIYIHHHTYDYINKFSLINYLLFYLIKKKTIHIFLDKKQKKKFNGKYISKNSIILKNEFAIKKQNKKIIVKRALRIGYYSLISKEKGIEIFFDTIDFLLKKNLIFKVLIAGPIDPKIKNWFYNKLNQYRDICIYKKVILNYKEKNFFFNSIDILLFPSIYKVEAYPLAIIESFSYGVPVIANDVGSVSLLVNSKRGQLVKDINKFKFYVKKELNKFRKNQFKKSNNCLNFFNENKTKSRINLKKIQSLMCNK